MVYCGDVEGKVFEVMSVFVDYNDVVFNVEFVVVVLYVVLEGGGGLGWI